MTIIVDGVPIDVTAKQEKLIAGDGVAISENEISLITPVRSVITQEEFNNLSEAEQNTGAYFIPDSGETSNGAASVYSTEERKVGRWINGKPIYRRVFQFNLKFVKAAAIDCVDISDLNIDEVIYTAPTYHTDNNNMIPYRTGDSYGSVTGLDPNRKILRFYCSDFSGTLNLIVLEYTKTSDYPTISLTQTLEMEVSE